MLSVPPSPPAMDSAMAVADAICADTPPGYRSQTHMTLNGVRALVSAVKDPTSGACLVKIHTSSVKQVTVGGTHGP